MFFACAPPARMTFLALLRSRSFEIRKIQTSFAPPETAPSAADPMSTGAGPRPSGFCGSLDPPPPPPPHEAERPSTRERTASCGNERMDRMMLLLSQWNVRGEVLRSDTQATGHHVPSVC